jgi:hypothetical protein
LASLGGSFTRSSDCRPTRAVKMAPLLMKVVEGKGAADAATLLGGVLK